MSQSENGEEINRREVAYRLFAAEFDDADYSYAESDEERAPNYVVTPTGARVNRVFVVGVLTEVEQVNEDVVRARIVDPTGAFVVYAGQYQPEALAALESTDTPSFVAVTGKARTFEPDDSDVVYTSIRPESVSEVDAETRDRWVVAAAEQTVDRVATMAGAHERVERGDTLREALEASGVEHGLAAGIPVALDHYGTTPAYFAAVRDLALDAARVVAGDVESVDELTLSPSDGGDVPLDFAADLGDVKVSEAETADAEQAEAEAESTDAEATEAEATEAESEASETETTEVEATEAETAEVEAAPEGADAAATATATDAEAAEGPAADASADGEMYELSDEEREEVEENYDVGFSSGDEIPDAGETDIDASASEDGTSGADDEGESAGSGEVEKAEDAEEEPVDAEEEPVDEEGEDDLGNFDDGGDIEFDDEAADEAADDADDPDDFTESEYDESDSDTEDADAGSMDLDLEDYVVDLMSELGDGDGAPRDEVIGTATDERDVDEGDVEDAIQDALMNGRCYEAGDDHLKAI